MQLVLMVLLATIILVFFTTRWMSRTVLSLARSATQISTGDFDAAVAVKSKDELGELGHSLERLRASLKAAIMRLDP